MRHPGTIADDDSFWFFLRLAHLPHVLLFGKGEEFDRVVDLTDLSWAHFAADGKVIEGGPRRLWSEIEDAYEDWSDLGRATRERFGMTFTVGRRHVWLDRSGSDHSWEV